MPATLTYPGVYIEEVPSGVRTVVGVATSITAFIGRARRGPVNDPVRIQNFGDYERIFGGLWEESTMSYSVALSSASQRRVASRKPGSKPLQRLSKRT